MGWVYIAKEVGTNFYKIGHTKHDPRKRVGQWATGNHEQLEILELIPGTKETETRFHKLFAPFHVVREWFDFSSLFASLLLSNEVLLPSPTDEGIEPGYFGAVAITQGPLAGHPGFYDEILEVTLDKVSEAYQNHFPPVFLLTGEQIEVARVNLLKDPPGVYHYLPHEVLRSNE